MNIDYRKGLFYNNGSFSDVNDALAIEESLNIRINGKSFTVTMRTPGNDTELITGLLFSEGVFQDDPELITLEITSRSSQGCATTINAVLPTDKILKDFEGSRNLVSASSCGLCGRTSFDDMLNNNKVNAPFEFDPLLIETMFSKMADEQLNFKETGGTHAAAAFAIDGSPLVVMEDIGRHNAVDKVLGSLLIQNNLDCAKYMLVSGRVSFEIVNKTLSAEIPVLASVSAPSSMAVNDAENAGITLIAFCRKNKLTVYSHPQRVIQNINSEINQ